MFLRQQQAAAEFSAEDIVELILVSPKMFTPRCFVFYVFKTTPVTSGVSPSFWGSSSFPKAVIGLEEDEALADLDLPEPARCKEVGPKSLDWMRTIEPSLGRVPKIVQ